MFHFMKKEKTEEEKAEKEKKRKDKKSRKERTSRDHENLSAEELLRLDEVRKSLKLGGNSKKNSRKDDKLPSGITADYRMLSDEVDFANTRSGVTFPEQNSDSSDTTSSWSKDGSIGSQGRGRPVNLPPASRSILKSKAPDSSSLKQDLDDANLLLKNTQRNENYENLRVYDNPAKSPQSPLDAKDKEDTYVMVPPNSKIRANPHDVVPGSVKARANSIESSISTSTSYTQRSSRSQYSPVSPGAEANGEAMNIGENLGVKNKHITSLLNFKLPGLSVENLPQPRELTITRSASGDFGFSLRRSVTSPTGSARNLPRTEVVFAEPSEVGANNWSGLIPGDRLISVNGQSMVGKGRDVAIETIKNCGDTVTLVVEPVAELSELFSRNRVISGKVQTGGSVTNGTLKRSGSRRLHDTAKTEDDVLNEKSWLETNKVWVLHKEGFSGATKLKGTPAPDGKIKVKLDFNQEVVEVDEDDVEKCNPHTYDRVEDLALLRFLNESSVLHTLRQRYGNNLIHSYCGPALISINPCTHLSIYSDKVMSMFKGCKVEDMPPHIYSVGQAAYRRLMATKKDQSVVMVGRSGSGKSTNFRHLLTFLSAAAGSANGILSLDKLGAIVTLLEAFGNTRTIMNANATRFTQIFSLDLDHSGLIVSASIQVMMLEKSRVVRRPEGEPNFNIFYQLLAGLDSRLRKEFQLENLNELNQFMTPLQRTEDRAIAASSFSKICSGASLLNITDAELRSIWAVLAAIYHLGVAGVSKTQLGRMGFARPPAAQRAAHCLGISVEELTRSVFRGPVSSGTLQRKYRSDMASIPDGIEALDGFVTGLYQETFTVLVALINRAIASPVSTAASILLLDTPGLQNPETCGGQRGGASFEDLCHNYCQERIQLMFHDKTITGLKERYESEQIEVEGLDDLTELNTPAPLVALIDKQSSVRGSQTDLGAADRRGLLWLLDEEAIFPGASDESFVERLLLQYSDRNSEDLVKKGTTETNFVLEHFQGTNPVLYNASGWLKASRENPATKSAVSCLHESLDKTISDLFIKYRTPISTLSGSIVGAEGSQSLRRASSIRRAFTSGAAGIKRHSLALQVKFQIDAMMEQLRRTHPTFVHCFLPQHGAGLCDVRAPDNMQGSKTSLNVGRPQDDVSINVPLVRAQLRGVQILDAVRLHKVGFPESLSYSAFWRRFSILDEGTRIPGVGEEKAAVENLIKSLDLDKSSFRMGNTMLFTREGVIAGLEEERDHRLKEKIVRLQALARGHLARKRLNNKRTQDIAMRCIQKNVRKFMGVRGWPWWRLLVKVTPLLNVHRTEEQLQARTDELEMLKAKLEKVEKDRVELKNNNEVLEARLREANADLAEEHSAAELSAERLEAEQADRMKLEKELLEVQNQMKQLVSRSEKMEMELLYSRAAEMNGEVDSDDESGGGVYKVKYERIVKEMEYSKKKLEQEHEDDLEQSAGLRKQMERKLQDIGGELDEQRQTVAKWRKKFQKTQGEMNDIKLLLEEQTARNAVLEKKQRKFDHDLALANEDLKNEREARENVQKDLDITKLSKFGLEDQLNALNVELEIKENKINSLSRELEEVQVIGADGEEIKAVKKQNNDLLLQLKDQEEELDDMAGQVQMMEATKIKVEMEMAMIKKEQRKEAQDKDDELEEVRAAATKKTKALEQQLEQEHEDRVGLLREKHDLEAKIGRFQDILERSGDEEQVSKLKKDLKRTKALLRDAQMMMERSQEGSNKVIMRQLKNQMEDAEFARTAAIKSKQNAELELVDVQAQLEDIMRAKHELEDKCSKLGREKADLSSQIEENEEDLQEVMRKYKASVANITTDQITITDQGGIISDLEEERNKLKEQLAEMSIRIESLQGESVTTAQHKRLELKIRELETKLELEKTTRGRMETQLNRLKEALESVNLEADQLRSKEQTAQEGQRKAERALRELKEDHAGLQVKENDLVQKKADVEKQLELSEAEVITVRNDLKLAMKRIEDLQMAIADEIGSDNQSEDSDDYDEDDDDELEALVEHQRSLMKSSLSSSFGSRMSKEDFSTPGSGVSSRGLNGAVEEKDESFA